MRSFKARKIAEEMRLLGVQKVAPCHCTGIKAGQIFENIFKKDFLQITTGSRVII